MHQSDLQLHPNEASDLCVALDRDVAASFGWDLALVTVLDEAHAESAIAVLGHVEGKDPGEGWEARRVPAHPDSGAGKTEDAEACARRDGWIYLLGSQFGKKGGPLSARRSWIARVSEDSLADGLEGGQAELEIARLRFGLHRGVNDALANAGIDLIELGPLGGERYIDGTIENGEKKNKRWAGRVQPGDYPINVEAMEFRAGGGLLLGLRYPVARDGSPILVEVDGDVDAIFADPDAVPECTRVWLLDDGASNEPVGLRALHTGDGRTFDAIVGDLDALNKGAIVLEDHPEGGEAESRHVRFELPDDDGDGGVVPVEEVHRFGDIRRVEGVVVDEAGHSYYVIDEEGHVALRTLVVDG